MGTNHTGQVIVIFASTRTGADEEGYAQAARDMASLAAQQPGFCGMTSTRSPDGDGITLSYWSDEAAAKAWRDHPEHARIRDLGRERWYSSYQLDVATVDRSYGWTRHAD